MKKIRAVIKSLTIQKNMMIIFFLGIASGLPLPLSSGTLKLWFSDTTDKSVATIGLLGLVSVPYTLKFLWAPFMDRWVPPFLGRRRGWILIFQLALMCAIASFAALSPASQLQEIAMVAVLVAFLSASLDIATDAYRTEILKPEERAMGTAMGVNGYRIAMLISGGLALVIADWWSWPALFMTMAFTMSVGLIANFMGPAPLQDHKAPGTLRECVVLPMKDFTSHKRWFLLLIFIVLYKIGDAFAASLTQTFLNREIHVSVSEIGVLVKTMGLLGTLVGTTLGALLIQRIGWFRALWMFGIGQAITNLIYWNLLWVGKNTWILAMDIFIENVGGGMSTPALLGMIMGLCNPKFTAFQFALLTSVSAVGRVFSEPLAGYVVHYFGWEAYFVSAVLLAIPALVILPYLRETIVEITQSSKNSFMKMLKT